MDLNSREHRPVASRTAPVVSQKPPTQPRRATKKWLVPLIVLVIVVAALYGVLSWLRITGPLAGVKSERYQAVFLTNNQVYFGKISAMTGDTITLRDVYYLKQSNSSEATKDTSGTQKMQLAHLGSDANEVHSPDSEMRISRLQVLFWENMKDDSDVVKKINQTK